jgi:D-alanyl-D-alanine carboxypeptidase (penicillin-binding protein 5/6)
MYPASTTKIMTAILIIENCKLSEVATVSSNAVSATSVPDGYVRANLKPGESFTIEQLLNVLLIPSANDAAIVLAEHLSGSINHFSELMNKKAYEIGCQNTHFVNPNGLHNENHYSTVYDMSLIAKYAMNNETFRSIVCRTSCSLPATDIYPSDDRTFDTTNELLLDDKNKDTNCFYEYANGIKTGYTKEANYCLAASAKKDDNEFIAITFGNKQKISGKSGRAIECINLFNYAIENYKDKKILSKDTVVKQIEINTQSSTSDPETQLLDVVVEDDIAIKTATNVETVSPNITIDTDLKAPILKGTVIGKIECEVDGTVYSSNLIANNNIMNSSYIQYIFYILLILLLLLILFTFIHKKNKKREWYL